MKSCFKIATLAILLLETAGAAFYLKLPSLRGDAKKYRQNPASRYTQVALQDVGKAKAIPSDSGASIPNEVFNLVKVLFKGRNR